jgi:poly(A) polymerase
VVYTQEEHGVDSAAVDKDAVYIVERLRANGFETYIVGGAVRDLILGKRPKDFDIVSAASPLKIKKIFRSSRIIGRRFRLVHVYFGPKIFEVSTFRSLKDGTTSNTYGSIEEDVLRRDFSLNALFYDPLKREVVDYVGGMRDIRARIIRPIIPLKEIFVDDPVRMIRAVKYAAATGCKLPLSLRWKMRRQSALLSPVSPSRLTEEILKILHSPRAEEIVESLESFGLYAYLQPRASALMKRDPAFRQRYMRSFGALCGERDGAEVPGETLAVLIRDYLEDRIDWDAGVAENYKSAFFDARQFVLPMNPPRIALDRGVRLVFAEHGITIKRSQSLEEGRIRFPIPERDGEGGADGEPKPKPRRKRRRNRSRRQTAVSEMTGGQEG